MQPWRLQTLCVVERKGTLVLDQLLLDVDLEAWRVNLATLGKTHFGPRAVVDAMPTPGGEIWVVGEFMRTGTSARRRRPHADRDDQAQQAAPDGREAGDGPPVRGVGGFNVRLVLGAAGVSVVVADHFGIGHVPVAFVSHPLQMAAEALKLRLGGPGGDVAVVSLHELHFPLLTGVLAALKAAGGDESDLDAFRQRLTAAAGARAVLPLVTASGARLRIAVDGGVDASTSYDSGERRVVNDLTPGEVAFVPLEVLESRERIAAFGEIDKLITSGRLSRAMAVLGPKVRADPSNRYLIRRLALLLVVGRSAGKLDAPALLTAAHSAEPNHFLILSALVQLSLTKGDGPALLTHLSSLGSLLLAKIPGANESPRFDEVLPELLGDAWAIENRQRAEECYLRVTEKRGDHPRLLRKLIALAQAEGRWEAEVRYLTRLLAVERRRVELARLHLRLAELRTQEPAGRDEALKLALTALKYDRGHERAAVFAADLLVESGRVEEAIQLLDSLLKAPPAGLTNAVRSRLEAHVARIWSQRLGRNDLAETRLLAAVAADPDNLGALKELEGICRGIMPPRGPEALADCLLKQFDCHERHHRGFALRALFEELSTLYRGSLARPSQAAKLYQRLLEANPGEPIEVERVLAWRDVTIDWHDLYARLRSRVATIPPGRQRAEFLVRLAAVSREKLGDMAQSLRHLQAALAEGYVDHQGFTLLIDKLTEQGDSTAVAHGLKLRLEQVSEADRLPLLLQLLALPTGLTDDERDGLALQSMALDARQEQAVQKRFKVYQAVGDVRAITRLLARIAANSDLGAVSRLRWLRLAAEALVGTTENQRFEALDRIFRQQLSLTEDRVAVLHEAVQCLDHATDQRLLTFYMRELIAAEALPALSERRVIQLLKGLELELASYHSLLSFKSQVAEVAANHALTAAALFGKIAGQDSQTERMLARSAQLMPCSAADLGQLHAIVARTGNWQLLAKALQRQADFEDEKQRKYTLLEQLGVLYWKKLKDLGRARLTFVLAMNHAPEPDSLKLVLGAIAAEAGDGAQERRALLEYLRSPLAARDLGILAKTSARLMALGEEPQALLKVFEGLIQEAADRAESAEVVRRAQIAMEQGIVSSEMMKTGFRGAMRAGREDDAVHFWWRGLAAVSTRARAKVYMAETTRLIKGEGSALPDLQLRVLKEALDRRAAASLGAKTYQELLVQYGNLLFEQDGKRRQALPVFQDAHRNDADDVRVWLPLYFLLAEFATPAERHRYLAELLPRLERDPRPLKSYPLTLESLAAEFRGLGEQVGDDNQGLAGDHALLPPLPEPPDPGVTWSPGDGGTGEQPASAVDAVVLPPPPPPSILYPEPFVARAVPAAAAVFSLADPPLAVVANHPQQLPSLSPAAIEMILPLAAGDPLPPSHGQHLMAHPGGPAAPVLDLFQPQAAAQAEQRPLAGEPAALWVPLVGQALTESPPTLDLGDLGGLGDLGDLGGLGELGEQQEKDGAEWSLVEATESASAQPTASVASKLNDLAFNLDDAGSAVAAGPAPMAQDARPLTPDEKVAPGEALSLDLVLGNQADLVAKVNVPDIAVPPPPVALPTGEPMFGGGPMDSAQSMAVGSNENTMVIQPSNSQRGASGAESRLPTATGGELNLVAGTGLGSGDAAVNGGELVDWRAAVLGGDIAVNLTTSLLRQAFASETEKHMAVQCIALLAGNVSELTAWHWRVWRHPEERGYPLVGRDRFPAGANHPSLRSPLHRFIIAAAPLMVRVFRDQFTMEGLARRIGVAPAGVLKLRQEQKWDAGLLGAAGFAPYSGRMRKSRFVAFALPSLGKEIFYEGKSRAIYFDQGHYGKVPPSHLFHRLLGTVWAVNLHHFVPTTLTAGAAFVPFMLELLRALEKPGFALFRQQFGKASPLVKQLATIDQRPLRELREKLGNVTEGQLLELWHTMRSHTHRLLLTETLDLVGLLESILDRDLLEPGRLGVNELLSLSPDVRQLVEFAVTLKL